jgi:hypothetical protein
VLDVFAGEPGLPLHRPFVLPPAARATPLPRLRIAVRPKRVRAGRRVRLRFRVTVRRAGRRVPVRRARVRLGGRHVRTGRRGRASLRIRFRHRGVRRAIASKKGVLAGAARVRVLRRR